VLPEKMDLCSGFLNYEFFIKTGASQLAAMPTDASLAERTCHDHDSSTVSSG